MIKMRGIAGSVSSSSGAMVRTRGLTQRAANSAMQASRITGSSPASSSTIACTRDIVMGTARTELAQARAQARAVFTTTVVRDCIFNLSTPQSKRNMLLTCQDAFKSLAGAMYRSCELQNLLAMRSLMSSHVTR